jgi:D-glucosaminate-6-phosphate ammonia-lyase
MVPDTMIELFERLNASSIINATGTITLHGGSAIDADITMAMAAAAQTSFDMADLQGRASEIIADCTGAEAGIVTSGASAGLLLGAAACMTGLDAALMGKLPDTSGMRNEFVVAHSHRNSYDHAVRAAGATLVEAGVADRVVGVGIRDTEPRRARPAFSTSRGRIRFRTSRKSLPWRARPRSPCSWTRPPSCPRKAISGAS